MSPSPFRLEGDDITYIICACVSPELISRLIIFQPYFGHFTFQNATIDIHIIAKRVQRRINISQLHINEAHQHHRIFWHIVFHLFSPSTSIINDRPSQSQPMFLYKAEPPPPQRQASATFEYPSDKQPFYPTELYLFLFLVLS